MHEKGFMHRDLKLENVLIRDDVLKLCDFGLSKRILFEDQMTVSIHGGTKTHMAPEIYSCTYYNYKVDIWSLGVMLYNMLFFSHPFGTHSVYKNI